VNEYRRFAGTDIKPALGSIHVSKVTAQQVDGFYTSLTQRGPSPASVRRDHALIHAALGRRSNGSLIPAKPMDRATPPSLKPTAGTLSVDDVQRLIAGAETMGDHVLACAVLTRKAESQPFAPLEPATLRHRWESTKPSSTSTSAWP
jgi:hypothetical protein